MAGKFIVLEGNDGSGTTTQAQHLVTYLSQRGYRVVASAEPTKSSIGQVIRKLLGSPIEQNAELLTSLALCFAADRMHHIHEVIGPGLKDCDFVILDRYVMSSMVYQGLHLPVSFVKEINRFAIKPDLTIILDLDATIAYDRLNKRTSTKEFYESPETLGKIRSRYLHFAKEDPTHSVVIDALGSIEHVHSHIVHTVAERFLG